MIKLKPRPAEPAFLRSDQISRVRRRIREKVMRKDKLTQKDFPSHWRHADVRLELWKHHNEKCCYCERKAEATREPDIDHFRPKLMVTGVRRKNSGYWWLAYDWQNLFFSCKTCNQKYKKNEFPLRGKRAIKPSSKLTDELSILIDPIDDDPDELIAYVWDDRGKIPLARPVGIDEEGRGRETIRILGLDRKVLNEERGRLLLLLSGLAEAMHAARHFDKPRKEQRVAKRIREVTSRHNTFAGFRRAYFRSAQLGEYVAND